jgi:hypothetical protein
MRTLLSEQYAPITSQIGFVRAGKPETVDALVRWRRELGDDVAPTREVGDFPAALLSLPPLVSPILWRELLVATTGPWTAYFKCGRRHRRRVGDRGAVGAVGMSGAGRDVPAPPPRPGPDGRGHVHPGGSERRRLGRSAPVDRRHLRRRPVAVRHRRRAAAVRGAGSVRGPSPPGSVHVGHAGALLPGARRGRVQRPVLPWPGRAGVAHAADRDPGPAPGQVPDPGRREGCRAVDSRAARSGSGASARTATASGASRSAKAVDAVGKYSRSAPRSRSTCRVRSQIMLWRPRATSFIASPCAESPAIGRWWSRSSRTFSAST